MKAVARFASFEWDFEGRALRKRGVPLSVPKQSLSILAALLERPGEIVTREQLQKQLWPDGTIVEFEHSISAAMNRLRTALGDTATNPRFIETLPGKGYRFVASVETATPDPPPAVPVAAAIPRRARWLLGASLLTIVPASILVIYLAVRRAEPDADGRLRSIAVLPLVNLSGDPEQEYFADGITEEIITKLSQARTLRVVSRTSVMRFKGKGESGRAIAKELRVDTVLEGSVQRSGDRVRVTAQLIDGVTDQHVWSRAFEGDARDVLSVRDDVAKAVADQLQVVLRPSEQTRFGGPVHVDADAFEAFLKGRYFAGRFNVQGQRKAVDYFEESVRRDPGYARAWAGLAHAIGYLNFWEDTPVSERCVVAMKRALELDPRLAEAHINLADLKFYWDWDWDGGEAAFRRAVELEPGSVDGLDHYAACLRALGRPCDALRPAERALHLDPLSPGLTVATGAALLGCGRHEEALEKFRMAIALDPGYQPAYTALAEAHEQLGRPDEALTEYLKREKIAGRSDEACQALEFAHRSGGSQSFKRLLAQEQLNQLQQAAKIRRVSPRAFAEAYVALGDHRRAIDFLEEAYRQRCPTLTWLRTARKWDPLRAEPRFRALLKRMFPEG